MIDVNDFNRAHWLGVVRGVCADGKLMLRVEQLEGLKD